ncbi:MAG TPA: DUF1697 domain-containing protein [Thermoanaerobaculia bacterium]|nr:DUF1697 domain-containing protein [Thermoanaerobaculia bacterium]
MTTFIVLLRGINVGGHKKVAMAELRQMLGTLGFRDATTLLQSGNAVFNATKASEAVLEKETKSCLGVECDYILRTADELKNVIAHNPLTAAAKNDPSRLLVVFMKTEPGCRRIDWPGSEIVDVAGRHAYISYPDGMGRSRLTLALIEKRLGTRGTARNWNTVLKLDHAADLLRQAR